MPLKPSRTSRISCTILLVALALFALVGASAGLDSRPSISTSVGSEYKRSLRTTDIATLGEDDSSEVRAFSTSTITTIKEATASGTKKLSESANKLAENVKTKLSSSNQWATDKLFTLHKVDKETSLLLETPAFQKWFKSVSKVYKKNPKAAEAAMFSTLKSQYGDDAVANMLQAAMDVSQTKDIAGKPQNIQLKNWLAEEKSADNTFNLLRLKSRGDNLFERPEWNNWAMYVVKLEKESPYEKMFSILKTRYDDTQLGRMLAQAKTDVSTKDVADKLEGLLIGNWVSERKTVDDVFMLLKLNNGGNDLLKDPALLTWVSFAEKLGINNPLEAVYLKLRNWYTSVWLSRMLFAAKGDSQMGDIAGRLQKAQFDDWVSTGTSPSALFTSLHLYHDVDNLHRNPLFETWVSYVTTVEKKNADNVMVSILKQEHDDAYVANKIAKARKALSTTTNAE